MANVNVKSMDITHRGAPFVELSAKAGLNVKSMDYAFRGLPYVNNINYDIVAQSISAKAEIVYTLDNTITSQARAKGKKINIYNLDKSIANVSRSQWTLGLTTYPFGGTFIASQTNLGRLDIGISKNGWNDLTATVTLKIWHTTAHLPSGTPMYTRVFQPSEIQQFMWYNAYMTYKMQPFFFDDPLPLVVGAEYAWTLEVSASEAHPYVLSAGLGQGSSGCYRLTNVGGTWYTYTTQLVVFATYAFNRIVTMARIKSTVGIGWIRDIVTPYSGGGYAMGYTYQCGGVWIATQDKVRMIKAAWYKGSNTTSKSYCNIYATDANHKPTGASLGQAIVDISNVPTGYGKMTDFIFPTDISLSIGTEYCFVISAPNIHQSGEYFNIECSVYNNKGNSEGSLYSTNGGSTWSFFTTGGQLWTFEILRYAPNILVSSQARIFNMQQKTISSKATINNIVEKTISTKSRIKIASNTKTTSAKAKIKTLNTKTVSPKAKIRVLNTKTIQSKSRIKNTIPHIISTKAKIVNTFTKTISTKARLKKNQTKTISVKSRIKRTINNSVGGKASIRNSITSFYKLLQEDGYRILQETADYILLENVNLHTELLVAKSRIKINNTKNISVKVLLKVAGIIKTTSAKAKIKDYLTKTIQTKARVKVSGITKTASSKGRIKVIDNIKSISSKSRIKIGGVTKTISAKARLKSAQAKTIQTKARVKNFVTKTIQSQSRIKVLGVTKTSQTKARMKKADVTKTGSVKSRILVSRNKSIQAKGRVKRLGNNKTIASRSRIKRFGVTKTASAKARIKQQELGRIVGLNKNTGIGQGVRVRVPLGLNKLTNIKVGTRVRAVRGLNKNTGLLVGQRLDL